MRTTTHNGPAVAADEATWVLDGSSSALELIVKHRLGPVSVTGAVRLAHGLLKIDAAGRIRVAFAIDAATLELTDVRDPRLGNYKLPVDAASHPIWFASTEVADEGNGVLHVAGELLAGSERVPVELEMTLIERNGALEVTARSSADHRRLGITWIPSPLKAVTELVGRARLVPAGRPRSATVRQRVNSRYRLMGGRPALSHPSPSV